MENTKAKRTGVNILKYDSVRKVRFAGDIF